MSEIKSKVLNGIIWTFSQQFGFQFINFFASIILARLLLPAEFGIIGIISIFISIGKSLVDSGMTSSLIRTTNPDQSDYSTVFFANLVVSIIVYLVAFAIAPLASTFFEQPLLTDLIRVYCLVFIVAAFSTVQSTRLNKAMHFKTQLLINIPSLLISCLVGVLLAYKGFGVWSLVWMNLVQVTVATIQLWVFSKWYPSLDFNVSKFKKHVSFGYKLTLAGLLNIIINNTHKLVIAKYFSASQLGFYTRAKSMQELPVGNISSALNKVTYPLFASIDDDAKLALAYKKLVQQVFFWSTPILLLAILIAEPLFIVLLTEKWLPAVPYFQVLCLAGIVTPLNSYNLNLLLVKGKSDLYFKLEALKNLLIIASVLFIIPFGILGLLWGQVITNFIVLILNSHYCSKFINSNLLEQVKNIFPIIAISIGCTSITYFFRNTINEFVDYLIVRMIIISVLFWVTYFSLSFFAKIEALQTVVITFKTSVLQKFK